MKVLAINGSPRGERGSTDRILKPFLAGARESGNKFFTTFGDVVSLLVLSGLWMGTLATAMPLTGEYSKLYWPPALWTNHVFIKTNAIITAVWAGIYLLQAILALIGHFVPAQAVLWMIVRHLLLVPTLVFTSWFQKWYPTYGSAKVR